MFKEYVKRLETHLDKFAAKEGFSTTKECFDLINRSVADDLIAVRPEKHFDSMRISVMLYCFSG